MTEKNNAFKVAVITPGASPPCLQADFGVCRGCSGWQAMLDAACSGDPLWRRTPIHCSVTGLTLKIVNPSPSD
ncbi:MAG: hypothetical protein JXO49_05025 [Deltaproteobacteria bacterium]|nr:hypothetical protein [Candidatus Anaeroferrophillus wilburensis]MBN2888690.1 hypothetical protein [Deltaproteobacteria bacterium]